LVELSTVIAVKIFPIDTEMKIATIINKCRKLGVSVASSIDLQAYNAVTSYFCFPRQKNSMLTKVEESQYSSNYEIL